MKTATESRGHTDTSRETYRHIVIPQLNTRQKQVMEALLRGGVMTCNEIAKELGLQASDITGRLDELMEAKRITRREKRKCRVTRVRVYTYSIIAENDMSERAKITYMGEEVPWDEVGGGGAVELIDYFKPVKLSPKAIDQCSKIVPSEHWIKEGLHTWLSKRADYVFGKLASNQTEGRLKSLRYFFAFDAEGPVLESVKL